MFGVPVDGCAWMFGDNQSVVTSSTLPHSTLSKRWNALSYHRVREAVAAKVLRFEHINGLENPADILTKALDHTLTLCCFKKERLCLTQSSSPLSKGVTNS